VNYFSGMIITMNTFHSFIVCLLANKVTYYVVICMVLTPFQPFEL